MQLLQRPYMRASYPKVDLSGCVFNAPLWRPDLGGATFYDLAGHNLCTVTGTTWGNQGRTLDGDDLININTVLASLATSTAGAWLGWAKFADATPASDSIIFSFGSTSTLEFLTMEITSTAKLKARAYKASTLMWALATDTAAFTDGVWAHIALIHNGTTPTLMVNGSTPSQTFSPQTDKTTWFSACTALDNGRIGCFNYNSNGNIQFITGTVGEFAVYNRALSAVEVNNQRLATRRYQ